MKKKVKAIEYNPAHKAHGYENVRWIENVSEGLRCVGFADKLAGIDHNGWFTDDDGMGEVLRGIVYQLPARNGAEAFVYGYADPHNDDCALLCFGDIASDKEQAARDADRFAELFAEDERDYQRAWSAGRRYEDLDVEIRDMRKEALAIGTEMRTARKARVTAPTICATLRNQIRALYRRIQKARKDRAELLANFGRCKGFTE